MKLRRAYQYRLYPTPAQQCALQGVLDRCRELYNAALEERREAHRHNVHVGLYSQKRQLPDIKKDRSEYAEIDAQVLQDVIYRVERAFQRVWAPCAQGPVPTLALLSLYGLWYVAPARSQCGPRYSQPGHRAARVPGRPARAARQCPQGTWAGPCRGVAPASESPGFSRGESQLSQLAHFLPIR